MEGERENDNETVGVGEPKTQTQRESDAMGIKPSPSQDADNNKSKKYFNIFIKPSSGIQEPVSKNKNKTAKNKMNKIPKDKISKYFVFKKAQEQDPEIKPDVIKTPRVPNAIVYREGVPESVKKSEGHLDKSETVDKSSRRN